MPNAGAASRRCLDQWTITGEVILIGEPSAPVRLAGFYTRCHDFFYAARPDSPCGPARLVTTVADLGKHGGEFYLCFDVASLPGWNQSRGLERYAPVDLSAQSGARLANETAWTARAAPGT